MAAPVASYTASELAARGLDNLPDELVSGRHLVYSSPATLAYNSPGAEGFGVKRAALAIPGSVMLLVAPGCCGRNTSLVSAMEAYQGRFFYLEMDETDIVTGRHLRRVPEAVSRVVESLETTPSIVMICITCVDALLGTDMERVCRKAEAAAGVPVRPCYMYALTREGRRPPMVAVRQAIYSLLEPLPKVATSVNLLGHFAPLTDDCELYDYLRAIGVKHVREVSRCRDLPEFMRMAEANFNLVLDPEARVAADYLARTLKIPSIELTRLFDPERIHTQYLALAGALSTTIDDAKELAAAREARDTFVDAHCEATFAVGECANADPFELALALTRAGLTVREVFGTLSAENFGWLRPLAHLAPELRVYSNMEPTMMGYEEVACPVDFAIGKDACYWHPSAAHLPFNEDVQPFGYAGVRHLYRGLTQAISEGSVS